MRHPVTLDGPDRAGNLARWQGLVQQAALSAHRFELHCWEDEAEAIALAGAYGREVPRDWPHGRVFAGEVTPAFVQMLLTRPLPPAGDACPEPLTPFFSLFFDNGFSGEHYGTEIYLTEEEDIP